MGFFDAMKKIIQSAEQVKTQAEQIKTHMDAASGNAQPKPKPQPVITSGRKTPDALLSSGSVPAKPAIRRKTSAYQDDTEYDVSFCLSGDFIEFNSHCEFDPSYQYEPDNTEDYTEFNENYPSIFISPDTEDAVEHYRHYGTVGADLEKLDNEMFLFKARFTYFGQVMWLYAFSEHSAMNGDVLALLYHPDVVGTPLEKKLIAALDEAAATYTETKANES